MRKALLSILTLLIASIIVFVGVRVIPGDPAQMMLGDKATGESLARLREELGLNEPIYVQYVQFLTHSIYGDFGRSIRTKNPAINAILDASPPTIELSIASIVFAVTLGISVGVLSAVKQYSLFDNVLMILILIGVSMPVFWSGLLLILVFGLHLGIFPLGGALGDGIAFHRITGMYALDSILELNWPAFKDSLWHLVLPTITLGSVPMAIITRMTRSSMLEVLRQDFVTTARSKGLDEYAVVLRHALKNALPPVITIVGLELGYLLSGAVVTETIFSRPGIGRLAVNSILYRDYPVVQGIVLLLVAVFVIVNLGVDVLYGVLDPQIRYG
jgi:peptide/nickel transport system permease protein